MRRSALVLAILLGVAASARAVTLRDIVELTRAGLGEEVMLALIQVDGGVFQVDAGTLTQLKAEGVSDKVIVALVRSGRERPPAVEPQPGFPATESAPPAPQVSQVIYLEQPPAPVVREVAVPVPVYVAVPISPTIRRHARQLSRPAASTIAPSTTAPILIQGPPVFLTDRPAPVPDEPVYWGSGGKLRPDAWKPR